ncbi:MAG: DUF547 domain-containing protein [Maricaulaceae bacterium]|nr:DUF547 domain-containing protein [Maricaulaceae bacterium]
MPKPAFIRAAAAFAALAFAPAAAAQAPEFSRFAPHAERSAYDIDYDVWTGLLRDIVLDVGISDRMPARGVNIYTGSRTPYGARGRYRYEGNRVIYHLLSDEYLGALSEYRRDLEALPGQIDFAALSRDEQLAYWLNLHNVTVIEQIALQYPVRNIGRLNAAGTDESLFEAKILTVAGVPLSLNDIRLRIVYPGWDNPLVIYGFFNGAVGGPNIRREAYTGAGVWAQLDRNAREFTSALRGADSFGGTLLVSHIYEEARPFYFPAWPESLRAHLRAYARPDMEPILTDARPIRASISEWAIADMINGSTRCGGIHGAPLATITPGAGMRTRMETGVVLDPNANCAVMPASAQILLANVIDRRIRLMREGVYGQVYIRDVPTPQEPENDGS